jgi:hypothetical protein
MGLDPDVIAAFFSGATGLVSVLLSLHITRRRAKKACEERIKEVRDVMREGVKLGQRSEDEEK